MKFGDLRRTAPRWVDKTASTSQKIAVMSIDELKRKFEELGRDIEESKAVLKEKLWEALTREAEENDNDDGKESDRDKGVRVDALTITQLKARLRNLGLKGNGVKKKRANAA